MVPSDGGKGRREAPSSLSPLCCSGSGELWEVERRVGGLSAAFYTATCCRETANHRSGQHSPFQHSYRHPQRAEGTSPQGRGKERTVLCTHMHTNALGLCIEGDADWGAAQYCTARTGQLWWLCTWCPAWPDGTAHLGMAGTSPPSWWRKRVHFKSPAWLLSAAEFQPAPPHS